MDKTLGEEMDELERVALGVLRERNHLRELVWRIQGALGTEEEGNALVEVAQNAHNAEMELAAIKRGNDEVA